MANVRVNISFASAAAVPVSTHASQARRSTLHLMLHLMLLTNTYPDLPIKYFKVLLTRDFFFIYTKKNQKKQRNFRQSKVSFSETAFQTNTVRSSARCRSEPSNKLTS